MRLIIAGSRSFSDREKLAESVFLLPLPVSVVICGGAPGADTLGAEWARQRGVPVEMFPANWRKYGRYRAGTIRNGEMAAAADALLAFWDGYSTGTDNMIHQATELCLRVWVVRFTPLGLTPPHP